MNETPECMFKKSEKMCEYHCVNCYHSINKKDPHACKEAKKFGYLCDRCYDSVLNEE